jgi:hypothetical protein
MDVWPLGFMDPINCFLRGDEIIALRESHPNFHFLKPTVAQMRSSLVSLDRSILLENRSFMETLLADSCYYDTILLRYFSVRSLISRYPAVVVSYILWYLQFSGNYLRQDEIDLCMSHGLLKENRVLLDFFFQDPSILFSAYQDQILEALIEFDCVDTFLKVIIETKRRLIREEVEFALQIACMFEKIECINVLCNQQFFPPLIEESSDSTP